MQGKRGVGKSSTAVHLALRWLLEGAKEFGILECRYLCPTINSNHAGLGKPTSNLTLPVLTWHLSMSSWPGNQLYWLSGQPTDNGNGVAWTDAIKALMQILQETS